jgi:heptosyltransferase I
MSVAFEDAGIAHAGQPIKRLLVVRLSSMGDIIHTLAAATLLREALPDAILGWMVEERWTALLCAPSCPRPSRRGPDKPLVDIVHPVAMSAWRHAPFSEASWSGARAALRGLREVAYEVAVDFQGAVRTAVIARWAGVGEMAGFQHPREPIASIFYRRRIEARGTHIVEQNVWLAAQVAGVQPRVPPIQLPIDPRAEEWCARASSATSPC